MNTALNQSSSLRQYHQLVEIAACKALLKSSLHEHLYTFALNIDFDVPLDAAFVPIVTTFQAPPPNKKASSKAVIGSFSGAFATQRTAGVVVSTTQTSRTQPSNADKVYLEFATLAPCSTQNVIQTCFAVWAHLHPEFKAELTSFAASSQDLQLAIVGIPHRSIVQHARLLKNKKASPSLTAQFQRLEALMLQLGYAATESVFGKPDISEKSPEDAKTTATEQDERGENNASAQ